MKSIGRGDQLRSIVGRGDQFRRPLGAPASCRPFPPALNLHLFHVCHQITAFGKSIGYGTRLRSKVGYGTQFRHPASSIRYPLPSIRHLTHSVIPPVNHRIGRMYSSRGRTSFNSLSRGRNNEGMAGSEGCAPAHLSDPIFLTVALA